MIGAAQLCLVLGVPLQVAQFAVAVGELALVAVFAGAGLLEGSAQFGLVARRVGRLLLWLQLGGLGGGTLEAAMEQLRRAFQRLAQVAGRGRACGWGGAGATEGAGPG